MSLQTIGFFVAALAVYALVSRRLSMSAVSAPMFFVVLGLFGAAVGRAESGDPSGSGSLVLVLELTLGLILFTDAMRLHFSSWAEDGAIPARLLGIGMPLTIVAGGFVAYLLFPDLGFWGAAIVATILAPTDAALGKAVVSNPRTPKRIREALNIESGLNDGIALPLLLFFIGALEAEQGAGSFAVLLARGLGVGVLVGVGIGLGMAWLIVISQRHKWIDGLWLQIAVVATALGSFVFADLLHGSGFVSAFVAGLSFGWVVDRNDVEPGEFAENLATLATMAAFFIFGAVILSEHLGAFSVQTVAYGIVSLTLIRMIPVGVSLIGSGLEPPSVLYIGWFGPRGLASIIFAAVVIEDLSGSIAHPVVDVMVVTVTLSILAHGVTAPWGSNRYGSWFEAMGGAGAPMVESEDMELDLERGRIMKM